MRATDSNEPMRLLVQNLWLLDFADSDEDGPFRGLVAAKSLVQIGSPSMPYLLGHVRQEKCSEEDLRLIAYIIAEIDGVQLGNARVKLELDGMAQENARPDDYLRRLTQMRKWFDEPDFFTHPRNWPGRPR
jgi:hypothetical protein